MTGRADVGSFVRPLTDDDLADVDDLLASELGGRQQARLGELHDVLVLPGFVAVVDDLLIGAATYVVTGDRAELAAIAVAPAARRTGVASALIDAVSAAVIDAGARELWLVTTNDNLDAIGLYQRRGFQLSELHPGAVDTARAIKPSIPLVGEHGIALRDELVLVRPLR
jgi:ribosomal protein S18 acetylase RimI-like enzyme